MRFEDYLNREIYESICKDNARKRYKEVRRIEREDRREKSKNTMSIIAGLCVTAIFLLMCICFLGQNDVEVQDKDLPIEDVAACMMVEIPDVTIEEEPEITAEVEPQEEFENKNIQEAVIANANRIDNVMVTHYCAEKYDHICNAGAPYKTALGHDVIPDLTCAVDPNIIPLGSTVFVDYGDGIIHEYFASDTGGAIKQARLDVAVDTHQHALDRGIKNATVWWIKE